MEEKERTVKGGIGKWNENRQRRTEKDIRGINVM